MLDRQTARAIPANPISFAIDGHQHVAIAAGNAIVVFGLPADSDRPQNGSPFYSGRPTGKGTLRKVSCTWRRARKRG